MKFEPNLAREIIQAYNLRQGLFKLWKHRGLIPDKYAKGYESVVVAPESSTTQKLRSVLSMREIAHTKFRSFGNHPNYQNAHNRAVDVVKGSLFTKAEVLGIKQEITEIRNLCRMANRGGDNAIKKLLTDVRVKGSVLTKHYPKITRNDRAPLSEQEKQETVLSITAFYNMLAV